MTAQVPTFTRSEYTSMAMRGSIPQTQKGGAPPVLPNIRGYMPDGTQEPTIPTSAPVAKWKVANHNVTLRLAMTFRNGINPI